MDEHDVPELPPADFLSERHRKAVKTAVFLAHEGHYRRAVKILDEVSQPAGGLAEFTVDTLARLKTLHPDASGACPDVPGDAPIHLPVTHRTLKTALKKVGNGPAPDAWGWTGELLQSLARDLSCKQALQQVCCFIKDGLVGPKAQELLLASWLIAIDRGPDKAPRPIAGGRALLKLAGQCVLAVGSSHVRTLFKASGVQFGIAIPDGVPTITVGSLRENPRPPKRSGM